VTRIPVDGSSRIASWGYDSEHRTMEIEFVSGGVYQYSDVPLAIWMDAQQAPSAGKWFDSQIKGVYPYQRLS